MSKKFEKAIKALIKEAKVSCDEGVAEDRPYEVAPQLWTLVCEEFGYYDYDQDEVVKES